MDDTCNVKIEDGTCNVKVEDEVLNDFTVNECYMTYPSPTLGYVSGGNESEIKVKCEDNNSLLQDIKSESIADSNSLQQDIKSEAHPSFHATVVGSGISIGGDTDVKRETLSPSCSVVLRRLNKCPVRCDTYRITSGSLHCAHSIPDTEASEDSLQLDSSGVDDIDTSSIHSDSIKEPEAVQTSNGESEVLEAPINEENNHNCNKKRCRTGKGKKEKKAFSNNHSMKESMHKSETSSQLDSDHTEPKRFEMSVAIDVVRNHDIWKYRCVHCSHRWDLLFSTGSNLRRHFHKFHSLVLMHVSEKPSKHLAGSVRQQPYSSSRVQSHQEVEKADLSCPGKRPGSEMMRTTKRVRATESASQQGRKHLEESRKLSKEIKADRRSNLSREDIARVLRLVGITDVDHQDRVFNKFIEEERVEGESGSQKSRGSVQSSSRGHGIVVPHAPNELWKDCLEGRKPESDRGQRSKVEVKRADSKKSESRSKINQQVDKDQQETVLGKGKEGTGSVIGEVRVVNLKQLNPREGRSNSDRNCEEEGTNERGREQEVTTTSSLTGERGRGQEVTTTSSLTGERGRGQAVIATSSLTGERGRGQAVITTSSLTGERGREQAVTTTSSLKNERGREQAVTTTSSLTGMVKSRTMTAPELKTVLSTERDPMLSVNVEAYVRDSGLDPALKGDRPVSVASWSKVCPTVEEIMIANRGAWEKVTQLSAAVEEAVDQGRVEPTPVLVPERLAENNEIERENRQPGRTPPLIQERCCVPQDGSVPVVNEVMDVLVHAEGDDLSVKMNVEGEKNGAPALGKNILESVGRGGGDTVTHFPCSLGIVSGGGGGRAAAVESGGITVLPDPPTREHASSLEEHASNLEENNVLYGTAVFQIMLDVADSIGFPLSLNLMVQRGCQLCPEVPMTTLLRVARAVALSWRQCAITLGRERDHRAGTLLADRFMGEVLREARRLPVS